jgi:hypothetical protein
MASDVGKEARQRADNYRKAVKYLDGCSGFTLENFREMNRLSGGNFSEFEMQRMYEESKAILPMGGRPGGVLALKGVQRKTLIEAIAAFDGIADQLGAPKSGGCFVATVAFDSPFTPEMRTLRDFRDERLLSSAPGRAFVRFYYRFGPRLARAMADKPSVMRAVRFLLRLFCKAIAIRSNKNPGVVR